MGLTCSVCIVFQSTAICKFVEYASPLAEQCLFQLYRMIHESGLTHTARSMNILSFSHPVWLLNAILFHRNCTSWLNQYHHTSGVLKHGTFQWARITLYWAGSYLSTWNTFTRSHTIPNKKGLSAQMLACIRTLEHGIIQFLSMTKGTWTNSLW